MERVEVRREDTGRLAISAREQTFDDRDVSKVSAGRFIELDDKRLVFVGDLLDKDGYGIGFRSSSGEITKFALSAEAATALITLLSSPEAGTFTDTPTFLVDGTKIVYRRKAVVTKAEAAERC